MVKRDVFVDQVEQTQLLLLDQADKNYYCLLVYTKSTMNYGPRVPGRIITQSPSTKISAHEFIFRFKAKEVVRLFLSTIIGS